MMKNLAMIACISKDGGLGKDNDLLWRIPADQKFFRDTTMGATVVMVGKTFASIGRSLPGRKNIVLSRSKIDVPGVQWASDTAQLYEELAKTDALKFIIGGASLYAMFLPEVEKLYLTEVDAIRPADVFFPDFDRADFLARIVQSGEHDDVKYRMIEYTRKDGADEE